MSLISEPDDSDWLASRRHLDYTLGRQAYNNGQSDQAIQHFVKLLSGYPLDSSDAEEGDDQGFLDDFTLAWTALGEGADLAATSSNLVLPEPIFDKTETVLISSADSENGTKTDAIAWTTLEKEFLDCGFPYQTAGGEVRKRPDSLLPNEVTKNLIVGG